MSAGEISPGRNSRGGCVVRSTIVDSIPPAVGPPSRISGIRPSRLANTCAACVGDNCDDRFALGAANGTPASRSSATATPCAGTRTATVAPPGHGIRHFGPLGQHQRQRPGPESLRQPRRGVRPSGGNSTHLRHLRHMHDQRIVGRPALGRKDPGHGRRVQGIRPQAVNRLGRKRHQPPPRSRAPASGNTPASRSAASTATTRVCIAVFPEGTVDKTSFVIQRPRSRKSRFP